MDEPEAFFPGEASIDVGWMFDALRSTDDSGPSALTAVIDGVNNLIADSEYDLLNSTLTGINVDTASKHVLLALARSTYPARTRLATWKDFVNRVDEAFRRRELDSDRLLKGLLH